jgi:hypothetical protein
LRVAALRLQDVPGTSLSSLAAAAHGAQTVA